MCSVLVLTTTMYTLLVGVTVVSLVFAWSHNPVHGVLTLVGVGLGFAGGLLTYGMEFTAFIVVLVYVGAVTILFIFVVMMVNLRATLYSFALVEAPPVWLALGVGLLLPWVRPTPGVTPPEATLDPPLHLVGVGNLLWGTDLVVVTTVVAGVLFVAMVAAICLSLVSAENYRTQEFYTQIRRNNSLFGFQPNASV